MNKARFNPAVSLLDVPAIPQAASWIRQYDGSLGPVMDFSQAVPDFPPHAMVLAELAAQAGSYGSTGYGDIEGEPGLRKAYARVVSSVYQQPIGSHNIHITSGCNQAFVATLIALAGSGDTVVVCNPCYFNHESSAQMLGIRLRYADCLPDNQFQPTVEAIEARIDDTVRVVALVSPNNPTGAIYNRQTLKQIFQLCQRRGVWLLLDETYRDFMGADASGKRLVPHDLFGCAAWQDTFIQLYSFSKSLSIPGHRLGAVTAGSEVVEHIAKVMDNIQICPPRAAQLAVAHQLHAMQDWIVGNAATIAERSRVFQKIMKRLPSWKVRSNGAYFAYVEHPFSERSSTQVAKTLAQHYGVLTLPGKFFGREQERYLRVAFANADSSVIESLADRLQQVDAREKAGLGNSRH